MTRVRIATRGSDLALWQARHVAGLIERALGVSTEIVPLRTEGDRLQGVSLAKVGGKGLFVKEIEDALVDGRGDVAVHSAKDLPAVLHPDLPLVAFPEREDPRDALVGRESGAQLADLPRGARVGTGSVRRTAQLRRYRPDLEIVPLRGNVPTRLRKIETERLDAVILACAGLERLGLGERIHERVAPEVLLPAVAQGAIAVQARAADSLARDLAAIDHAESARRVAAERAFLTRLGGDCNVPLAALAELQGKTLRLRGLVIETDGSRVAEAAHAAEVAQAEATGVAVAEAVLRGGGAQI
ncbi:MAG TPA: hydroxymethylbilane synthase, partial [Myxococcota bacterium]